MFPVTVIKEMLLFLPNRPLQANAVNAFSPVVIMAIPVNINNWSKAVVASM
tara:strand:+ start:1928 stop:2080 length:153 start_codon:yes stop_codon:yes gene_type:complete